MRRLLIPGKFFAASVVLAVLPAGCSFLGSDVTHRVHDGSPSEYGPVSSVSDVAWGWEVPDLRTLDGVVSGSAGPLMMLDNGVVALDGESGDELWHYLLEEGRVIDAHVTPDAEEAVLRVRGEAEADSVLVLDSGTGDMVAEYDESLDVDLPPFEGLIRRDLAVLNSDNSSHTTSVVSLGDGATHWDFELPESPEFDYVSSGGRALVGGMVIVSGLHHDVSQPGRGQLQEQVQFSIGLDGLTGEVQWETDQRIEDSAARAPNIDPSDAGDSIYVGPDSRGREGLIMDPETGHQIEGERFQDRRAEPVAMYDEGYVDLKIDFDADRAVYRRLGFDGREEGRVDLVSRDGEGEVSPGIVLEEGVLRQADPGTEESGGDIQLEFAQWGGGEKTRKIDVGVEQETESGELEMVPVAGSVVLVQDRPPENDVVFGLN